MNFKLKMVVVTLFFLILILITGCAEEPAINKPEIKEQTIIPEVPEVEPTIKNKIIIEESLNENIGCTHDDNCTWGENCIDGTCGKIAELYETENCTIKCNFNEIVVETSDDQTFNLNRGRGDYTSAGAIEWILANGPDYCQGQEIIVPVKILKKNYGKVINKDVLTVKVGETSPIIKHPTIDSIKFTFKVKSVNEECS